ncbi:MAG: NrsF family protein [Azospirillaceae bacterium]|nr:NrsF family protein [Azospirillaceae bacterium]
MTQPTETLIQQMSAQAGGRAGLRMEVFPRVLALVVLLALACAIAVVLVLENVRPDIAVAATQAPFLFKLAGTGVLALAGAWLVSRAVAPGRGGAPVALLLPGLAILAFRAATDRSGLSWLGLHRYSAPICMGIIIAASLPALAALILLLRQGAPTRPVRTAALAGALAGALGAMAYALACENDAGSFVLLWYGAAIAIVAAVGALAGRVALRW